MQQALRVRTREIHRLLYSTIGLLPSTTMTSNNLWSIQECLENREKIKFVDGTWFGGDRNARQDYDAGPRIPGSQFFDMSDIGCSKELFPDLNPKGLPYMFPPKSLFAATMDAMGIQKEDQVIVYGRRGCSFTPRIWYMFKTYGHEKVGLMQGSLEEWIESKGPVDDMPTEYNVWAKDLVKISETQYPASEKDHIVDMQQVLGMLGSKTIVDTRGPGGYGKGHIPGSTNIPFSTFVDSDNSLKFKPKAELEQILDATQLNKDDEILLCCAGAVSVCHLALALDECGYSKPLVYDGSWAEWGKDPSTPKETSEND